MALTTWRRVDSVTAQVDPGCGDRGARQVPLRREDESQGRTAEALTPSTCFISKRRKLVDVSGRLHPPSNLPGGPVVTEGTELDAALVDAHVESVCQPAIATTEFVATSDGLYPLTCGRSSIASHQRVESGERLSNTLEEGVLRHRGRNRSRSRILPSSRPALHDQMRWPIPGAERLLIEPH